MQAAYETSKPPERQENHEIILCFLLEKECPTCQNADSTEEEQKIGSQPKQSNGASAVHALTKCESSYINIYIYTYCAVKFYVIRISMFIMYNCTTIIIIPGMFTSFN